jgi:hypothetical protein
MKKVVLGMFVALIAVSPAVAAKKSKAPAKIDSNKASWRLVKGSLPIYLPAWSMPLYMAARRKRSNFRRSSAAARAHRPRRFLGPKSVVFAD